MRSEKPLIFPLVGAREHLERYFQDMISLPITVTISTTTNNTTNNNTTTHNTTTQYTASVPITVKGGTTVHDLVSAETAKAGKVKVAVRLYLGDDATCAENAGVSPAIVTLGERLEREAGMEKGPGPTVNPVSR